MTAVAPIVPCHLAMAAARKIAALKSVSWLLVEADGRLVGTLDRRALMVSGDDDLVSACMTELPLAVLPTTTAASAYELMVQHRLTWLPVAAGTMFIVGAVSRQILERVLAGASRGAARLTHAAA
jgi:CBS domain-containing protein